MLRHGAVKPCTWMGELRVVIFILLLFTARGRMQLQCCGVVDFASMVTFETAGAVGVMQGVALTV